MNTVDKYVVDKWFKHPITLIFLSSLVALACAIFLAQGFLDATARVVVVALLSGAVYAGMSLFYFKAMQVDEVTRVVPLFYLGPLFVMVPAAVFLHERFAPMKYVGLFLLVLGAVTISSRSLRQLRPGKAFGWMLFSTLAASLSSVLTKYAVDHVNYWQVFAYGRLGYALAALPFAVFWWHDVRADLRKPKRIIGLVCGNEALTYFGTLLFAIAFVAGPVTLVTALNSVQALYLFVIALVVSRCFPALFKEENTLTTSALKLLSIVLMAVGSVLVAI